MAVKTVEITDTEKKANQRREFWQNKNPGCNVTILRVETFTVYDYRKDPPPLLANEHSNEGMYLVEVTA